MTYQEAAQMALDVQNAVSLSGVVYSFAMMVQAIWDEAHRTGKGTDWVNTHPIVTVVLDKLSDLNGRANEGDTFDAQHEVQKIAKGREAQS